MEIQIGQVFLSIAGESVWSFQALCRELGHEILEVPVCKATGHGLKRQGGCCS